MVLFHEESVGLFPPSGCFLKHCASSSFLDSTFWKDKSVLFPKLRSMGCSSHSIILPWGSFTQCVQKGPAQIQPLRALWPSWGHDGCSVTEFVAFRLFFHSLHTEILFSARKDITGDKIKDKLLSGLISATWNTKLTIFFSVILSDCRLLSSPKEIGKKKDS